MALTRQLRPAIMMVLVMTVLTGLLYPGLITAIAQIAFPYQANGSLITKSDGTVVGSPLIGQYFDQPIYFQPRPSAAGVTDQNPGGYDPTSSGGSNLGPTNPALIQAVSDRVSAYRAFNGLAADVSVPVDAVTASASGLDPQISVANALLQAPRVARENRLSEDQVRALIQQNTAGRDLGFLGEPGVNVLTLNLAVDQVTGRG